MHTIENILFVLKAVFMGFLIVLAISFFFYDVSHIQILYLVISLLITVVLYLLFYIVLVVDAHQKVITMLTEELFGLSDMEVVYDKIKEVAKKYDNNE